jgi:uncharacterized membrane protein YdfJ with MMPL/SSD domain
VHRARETPETAAAPLTSSTGKAVLVSGLTTMVGFGSLLVARHVGIFSLGALLTLAIGCNLAAAFIVLPLVLYLFPLDATPTDATRHATEVRPGDARYRQEAAGHPQKESVREDRGDGHNPRGANTTG